MPVRIATSRSRGARTVPPPCAGTGRAPLASSAFSYNLTRTATLRIELEPGEYVVHVRLDHRIDKERVSTRTCIRCTTKLTRTLPLQKRDGFPHKVGSWDPRKVTRIRSEMARSKSIAANFNARRWQDSLVVPIEALGGRDINEIQSADLEAESAHRRELQELGLDVRPSIAVTRAHMKMSEIDEAARKGDLTIDGKILLKSHPLVNADGTQSTADPGVEISISKAAVEPVWYLPGIAERFGM